MKNFTQKTCRLLVENINDFDDFILKRHQKVSSKYGNNKK